MSTWKGNERMFTSLAAGGPILAIRVRGNASVFTTRKARVLLRAGPS